jgi:hypothetical protein
MAMHRFMHVGFTFAGVPKVLDLEPAFYAIGDDWIRYSATSWIIWTERPATEIFARLRPHIDANDQVWVIKIDLTDSFGSLSPWIWTWINSKIPRAVSTGDAADRLLPPLLMPPPPPPPWGKK